jgi:CHASE2 domain-containing sensor protein
VNVLLQIGLLALLAFLGFAGGGMVGAQFVPEGNGLAGGATVFLWAMGGLVAGIIGGAVAVSRLPVRAQRRVFLVCVVLAVLVLAGIGVRIARQAEWLPPGGTGAFRSG